MASHKSQRTIGLIHLSMPMWGMTDEKKWDEMFCWGVI